MKNDTTAVLVFIMDDINLSDPLDREIMARLMQEFNNPGQLTLGFFHEALSDTNPQAELRFNLRLPGRHVYQSGNCHKRESSQWHSINL